MNREPRVKKIDTIMTKFNPWFIALIELSAVNGLIVRFVLFSRLCHKFSPLSPVSLSLGAAVLFRLVQSFPLFVGF